MQQALAMKTPRLTPNGRDPSAVRPLAAAVAPELDAETQHVYRKALEALGHAGVEFLIGGAYALAPYTNVVRDTKDLDVFLRREDCEAACAALGEAGFTTELTFPHWLAKAYVGDRFIDLIYSAGNGVAVVDDLWFAHAVPGSVIGIPVRLCPPEEMIWSKAFVMERERYDGADVAHLILACGPHLDWRRLLRRFGGQWRVLLSHLILFGFIYPCDRAAVPEAVMRHLLRRLDRDRLWSPEDVRVCDGTLLSRQQYLIDINERGYADGRLAPRGEMSTAEIAHWTSAIGTCPGPEAPPVHLNDRPGAGARRRRR
jgi:Uncharacterised nucleotidyltransferase